MDIAFCYESVLPERGGCEMYIASLARRLAQDGHTLHLYASRWDEAKLPKGMRFHRVAVSNWPRSLRPWRFGSAVLKALEGQDHDATIGFDKTWGLDILYPQGGLYAASAEQNIRKEPTPARRDFMRMVKKFDLAHQSFLAIERKQYLGQRGSLVIAISEMVRGHFQKYYGIRGEDLRVVRIATNADRFSEQDRPLRRHQVRERHGIRPEEVVALFCGMNYRLKGLIPLLHAVALLPREQPFRLLACGSSDTREMLAVARKLGVEDRVVFAGYCPDMRDGYFAADMFVHPTFYDPCSHVVPEAMSCGLPVITTRYNGASELMSPPREGFLIDDPHQHHELAAAISHFFDPAKRQACGQAGRKSAGQWTFEHHYRQMLDVFHEARERRQKVA